MTACSRMVLGLWWRQWLRSGCLGRNSYKLHRCIRQTNLCWRISLSVWKWEVHIQGFLVWWRGWVVVIDATKYELFLDDCGDGSDESIAHSCGNRTCTDQEFHCTANAKLAQPKYECIPKAWWDLVLIDYLIMNFTRLCDGEVTCADGADETEELCGVAKKECNKNEFRCKVSFPTEFWRIQTFLKTEPYSFRTTTVSIKPGYATARVSTCLKNVFLTNCL